MYNAICFSRRGVHRRRRTCLTEKQFWSFLACLTSKGPQRELVWYLLGSEAEKQWQEKFDNKTIFNFVAFTQGIENHDETLYSARDHLFLNLYLLGPV